MNLEETILASLTRAGSEGLSASKLPDSQRQRRVTFTRLEAEGKIVRLEATKPLRYTLREHDRSKESAIDHVLGKATPGQPTAYSLAMLQKGLRGRVKQMLRIAVDDLVQQRRLLRLRVAGKDYWLHDASILPLLQADAPESIAPRTLEEAYQRAKLIEGFSDVPISLLLSESGLPLKELHRALLQMSRSGEAMLSVGAWSLSSPEEKAAVLDLDGHQYLLVRFLNQTA